MEARFCAITFLVLKQQRLSNTNFFTFLKYLKGGPRFMLLAKS
jgi:hypothetical protein